MKALCLLSYLNEATLNTIKNSTIVNISNFKDERLEQTFYKCELGSQSYVLALLCTMCGLSDFDTGELSAECCLGEEEAEEIIEFLKEADTLILDNNLLFHKDKSIYYFAKKLAKHFNLELIFDYEFEQEQTLLELDNYNGLVLYECLDDDLVIEVSQAFMDLAKIQDKQTVEIKTPQKTLQKQVKFNPLLKGLIGLSKKTTGYAYSPCTVKGVNNEN